jgi:hypothetical protein
MEWHTQGWQYFAYAFQYLFQNWDWIKTFWKLDGWLHVRCKVDAAAISAFAAIGPGSRLCLTSIMDMGVQRESFGLIKSTITALLCWRLSPQRAPLKLITASTPLPYGRTPTIIRSPLHTISTPLLCVVCSLSHPQLFIWVNPLLWNTRQSQDVVMILCNCFFLPTQKPGPLTTVSHHSLLMTPCHSTHTIT